MLEVIALTPEDAVAAERGGADRLEIVRTIETGGLTPELDAFERIRAATSLTMRVMLRTNAGFSISAAELDVLCRGAERLKQAGAEQFVLGFLDESGGLDVASIDAIVADVDPCPWTLHHAFDHAADARSAWNVAQSLANLDCILSGGAQGDLSRGLAALVDRAAWQTAGLRWLAGGGLVLDHVATLRRAGIEQIHIGRAARLDRSWSRPVSADSVRAWSDALRGPRAVP
jgi:copper homeostasis protein